MPRVYQPRFYSEALVRPFSRLPGDLKEERAIRGNCEKGTGEDLTAWGFAFDLILAASFIIFLLEQLKKAMCVFARSLSAR
jgi:hypothetical protein